MTKQYDERLSILMDGEVDAVDTNEIIDQLCSRDEMKERWERYHLIRDVIRGNYTHAMSDQQFSQSIMSKIDSEPAILAPSTSQTSKQTSSKRNKPSGNPHIFSSPAVRRLAGMAIAASVATIGVIGVQQQIEPIPVDQLAESEAEIVVPSGAVNRKNVISASTALTPPHTTLPSTSSSTGPTISQASAGSKLMTQKKFDPLLHKYLLNHNQHSFSGYAQGLMPYARIVATHPDRQSTVESQVQR